MKKKSDRHRAAVCFRSTPSAHATANVLPPKNVLPHPLRLHATANAPPLASTLPHTHYRPRRANPVSSAELGGLRLRIRQRRDDHVVAVGDQVLLAGRCSGLGRGLRAGTQSWGSGLGLG